MLCNASLQVSSKLLEGSRFKTWSEKMCTCIRIKGSLKTNQRVVRTTDGDQRKSAWMAPLLYELFLIIRCQYSVPANQQIIVNPKLCFKAALFRNNGVASRCCLLRTASVLWGKPIPSERVGNQEICWYHWLVGTISSSKELQQGPVEAGCLGPFLI